MGKELNLKILEMDVQKAIKVLDKKSQQIVRLMLKEYSDDEIVKALRMDWGEYQQKSVLIYTMLRTLFENYRGSSNV